MTIKELREKLALLDSYNDTEVIVSFRYKTGYDEGDIYEGDVCLEEWNDKVRITSRNFKIVGGW